MRAAHTPQVRTEVPAHGLPALRSWLRWGGLVWLLLAAWNFLPRAAQAPNPEPAVRLVLVDASASVRAPRPDWLRWVRTLLRDEAELARAQGQSFAVVSFAAAVGRSFGPGAPELFLDLLQGRTGKPLDPRAAAGADDATRLARALETAAELVLQPERRPGTIVIAGTERWTDEHPGPQLTRLARGGVRIERRRAPARTRPDLGVREVRLPAVLEEGAPLLAVASLFWLPGATEIRQATLEVSVHNAGSVDRTSIDLDLSPLGGALELPIPCGLAGPGRTEVHVRARITPGPDASVENDHGMAATRARGELLVLVCAEPDQMEAARAWLAPSGSSRLAGVQFLFAELDSAAPHYGEVDAVVSFDVPPGHMPKPLVQALLERGGGYLATSGWRFLEDWTLPVTDPDAPDPDVHEPGFAALLPARPAPLDRGPRDVVLLVDGSGSMEGAPFESVRAASLDLVRAALPSDQVSLRFFTSSLLDEHVIKPRSPRGVPKRAGDSADARRARGEEAARTLLGLHVPSGQTYLFASLESFVLERSPDGPEALVFVLSDGLEREYSPDPEGRAAALRKECLRRGVDMIPIAIGERAQMEFLARLGRPGEPTWRPDSLEDLREIFRREILGAKSRGGPALPIAWSPAGDDDLVARIRGRTGRLAPLERFVKNEARSWGEVVWEGDQSEPVLVLGRVGLGRSALFASLPGPGWGSRWTNLPGPGEPAGFAGILRWLARGATRREGTPELSRVENTLILSGLGPLWPAVLEVPVVDALDPLQSELLTLSFFPSARAAHPDPLGERTAQLPANSPDLGDGVPVLRLTGPAGRSLWFPWEEAPRPEFHGGGELLLSAWWEAVEPEADPSEAEEGSVEGAAIGRLAPVFLGLGLAALFLGFLHLPSRSR